MGIYIENPSNLVRAFKEFQDVTKNLNEKQKNDVALKTLIIVCRQLDKAEWKIEVKAETLARLTSQICDVVTELSEAEYKKYVAVICNVNRCIVKKNCSLALSVMVLRCIFDKPKMKLVANQSKNYFLMLTDVLQFIDKEKINKINLNPIIKMFLQYFEVIDTLVIENLVWFIKKCDALFNNVEPENLNATYQNIFTTLINNEKIYKNSLSQHEPPAKLNKILCIVVLIHDNNNKCAFKRKDSIELFLKLCLKLFQSNKSLIKMLSDICAVFPVFANSIDKLPSNSCHLVSNFIYKLFSLRDSAHSQDLEEVCMSLKRILCVTLSHWLSNPDDIWKKSVSIELQINVLQLINAIIKVLSKSQLQNVQCNGCSFNSAIHDSFPLIYFGGMFLVKSIKSNMNSKEMFPIIKEILNEQIYNLKMLFINGCPNWKLFWKKMENSQHNYSIELYSNKHHKYSLMMFSMYINNVIKVLSWSDDFSDLNYMAKGFYNMAICQSDLQLNYSALISCYMSWILNTLKSGAPHEFFQFSLIIQIKAKMHSQIQSTVVMESTHDDFIDDCQEKSNEELQLLNIWTACKYFLSNRENTIFFKILSRVKFGELLLLELDSFLQSWPSTNSISGICDALRELSVLSDSFLKPSNSSPDNIGILDPLEIAIACGKAVTLIIKHSVKLSNDKIVHMIVSTAKTLENISQTHQRFSKSTLALIKLFWANALFAHGMCKMHENRKLGSQNPLVEAVQIAPLAPHHPNIHPDDLCDVTPAHQYLNLNVEEEIMESMYKAVNTWKEVVKEMGNSFKFENQSMKMYTSFTCDIIELCCQVFALHSNEYSLLAADVTYSLSNIADNTVCAIRSAGYMIENANCRKPELDEMITKVNNDVYNVLLKDDEKPENTVLADACLEYLLSLSIFYYNVQSFEQGATILCSVSKRILYFYVNEDCKNGRKLDDIKLTYAKMLKAQSNFISNCQNKDIKKNMFSILTSHINANIDCGDIVKAYEHVRGRSAILSQRMWLESGVAAGEIALSLGLVRRARALLRVPLSAAQRLLLPRRATHLLILLAQADLVAERHDDCMAKIEGIKYILGEKDNFRNKNVSKKINWEPKGHVEKETNDNDFYKNFEMVLDVPIVEQCGVSVSGSPTFRPTPFVMPEFISHQHSCSCSKCNSIVLYIIYMNFFKLEAELQLRNGESKVAGSFYEGGMKFMKYLFQKLDCVKEKSIGSFINYFGQRVFDNFKYHEMLRAECYFQNDAVMYFIMENETNKAKDLNKRILEVAEKELRCDYFLLQLAEEHRLFLMQSDVFKKSTNSVSQLDVMDELQNEMSSKLIITPEKSKPNRSFITPRDKKLLAVNRIKRNVSNASLSPSSVKNDFMEFVCPAIKLKLEDADNEEINKQEIDKRKALESPEQRTPAPKMRNAKPALVLNAPAASRTRTQKTLLNDGNKNENSNKQLKPKNPTIPTQENAALKVLFGNKSHPKVYANKAARNTMKFTISPNNILIETQIPSNQNNMPNKLNDDEIIQESPKENKIPNLRARSLAKKSEDTKSLPKGVATRPRMTVKKEDKSDAKSVIAPSTTRYSTRKR